MRALGVMLLVVLAGCMGAGPSGGPDTDDSDDAPGETGHDPALESKTLTRQGQCARPVFSTTVLQGPEGLFTIERPAGFDHMRIEVNWDAVVAPTMTLGAWLAPEGAFFVDEAWMVAEPANPFVFDVDDDMWRNGSTTGLEVALYVEGADVVNGDDAALVAACSYQASVEMVTRPSGP